MADVDMTDAAPAEDKGKAVTKTAKSAGAEGAVDNKKKFEVKKVRFLTIQLLVHD
jgi:hypothetical protein